MLSGIEIPTAIQIFTPMKLWFWSLGSTCHWGLQVNWVNNVENFRTNFLLFKDVRIQYLTETDKNMMFQRNSKKKTKNYIKDPLRFLLTVIEPTQPVLQTRLKTWLLRPCSERPHAIFIGVTIYPPSSLSRVYLLLLLLSRMHWHLERRSKTYTHACTFCNSVQKLQLPLIGSGNFMKVYAHTHNIYYKNKTRGYAVGVAFVQSVKKFCSPIFLIFIILNW